MPTINRTYKIGDSELVAPASTYFKNLEDQIGGQIWAIINCDIDGKLKKYFYTERDKISDRHVCLVIDSSGGLIDEAYAIARLFQRRADKFTVIVPCYAKSSATLIAIAAEQIIMGKDAELGPIDPLVYNPSENAFESTLDTVKSVESLSKFSNSAFDAMMMLIKSRIKITSEKRLDTLISMVFKYCTDLVKPLISNVDVIEYTKRSRGLQTSQEYAKYLLNFSKNGLSEEKNIKVARALSEWFPSHGFFLDKDILTSLGMRFANVNNNVAETVESIADEIQILKGFNKTFRGLFYEQSGSGNAEEAHAIVEG